MRKLVLLKSPATCRLGIFWKHKTNVMYMSSFSPFVTLETVKKHYLLKMTLLCKQFYTVFSSVSLSEADRIHTSIPCQRNWSFFFFLLEKAFFLWFHYDLPYLPLAVVFSGLLWCNCYFSLSEIFYQLTSLGSCFPALSLFYSCFVVMFPAAWLF